MRAKAPGVISLYGSNSPEAANTTSPNSTHGPIASGRSRKPRIVAPNTAAIRHACTVSPSGGGTNQSAGAGVMRFDAAENLYLGGSTYHVNTGQKAMTVAAWPSLVGPAATDLNNDSVVDGADVGLLLAAWGPCAGCPADLDGNGVVDGADLGVLLGAWGK